MVINTKLTLEGKEYGIEYHDVDDFAALPPLRITQSYGVCFCEDKLLIGRRAKNGAWGHVGGSLEPGETPEQTLQREVQEESNMQVTAFAPLGYQVVINPEGEQYLQLRYVCRVRPLGGFVSDPALDEKGGIDAIKLIDPATHKQYFDWGKVGDRLMERALKRMAQGFEVANSAPRS